MAVHARACRVAFGVSFRSALSKPGQAELGHAVLGALAVVLNAVTTGDHLGRTRAPATGPWLVDLMLLASAGAAVVAARRQQRANSPECLPSSMEEPEHA